MTTQNKHCSKCQSDDITYSVKHSRYRCEDCDHIWHEEQSRENVAIQSEKEFCRRLANSENWNVVVINDWPAPIAHEYEQLKKILNDGAFISAMLQLKDVAEILIKFHTISMYQWIQTHKPDLDANSTQPSLFSTLSMGGWYNLSGQFAKLIIKHYKEGDQPLGIQLANYFFATKSTPINKLFANLIAWRNKEIGHGAFRLNTSELWDEFESLLQQLHEHIAVNDPWQHYQLVIDESDSNEIPESVIPISVVLTPLIGSDSIHLYHSDLTPSDNTQHIVSAHALYIIDKTNIDNGTFTCKTPLSPLIQAHTCNICRLQDVFIFDGHNQRNKKFFYIDYLTGHQLGIQSHQSPLLEQTYHQTNLVQLSDQDSTLDKLALNQDVVKLLKEKSLEANYLSPKYLQESLVAFINSNDKGLFWLTAPAHVGKSIFVHGIANNLDKKVMLDDLIVIRFHIRREFRYFSHHMTEALGNHLKEAFNLTSGNHTLPNIDTSLGHSALVTWLNQWWGISPYKHTHQLLVAIDGLDEIGRQQAADSDKVINILDLLPTTDTVSDLDDNIYLLLTSRPVEECPSWMQRQLSKQFKTSLNESDIFNLAVTLDYPAYSKLLKEYFTNNLHQQLNSLKSDKQDYIDSFFTTLLEKSEKRFLYFSLLVDIIKEQNLDLAQLKQLPTGEDLYSHFINNLESKLGGKKSKHFIKVKQLLTLLTACEQASVMDAQIIRESASNPERSSGNNNEGEIVWSGVDLATIAGLLNESAGQHSTQLIFTLYTLKSLLSVERSEDQAQYRLGLKELAGFIDTHWADDVLDWHRQMSESFYYSWKDRWDELDTSISENNYQLRYLLAHSRLLTNANYSNSLFEQVINDEKIDTLYTQLYNTSQNNSYLKKAIEWISLSLFTTKELIQLASNDQSVDTLNFEKKLVIAYRNRGVLNYSLNHSDLALQDYQKALELFETLQQRLRDNFPNEWQNDLAKIYINRGILHHSQNQNELALQDFKNALELFETLQQRLQDNFPYEWQSNLATAYMNYGVIHCSHNQNELALQDYQKALELFETLQRRMQNNFPYAWQSDLAKTYMNRGWLYQSLNQPNIALQDYQRGIGLSENLQQCLQDNFPNALQNDLARSYMNRGYLYKSLNQTDIALQDYQQAIDLRENLKQHLQDNFPNEWQNDLAGSYIDRGQIYDLLNQPDIALQDYQQAIDLRENLQQCLQDNFPNALQNDLARSYMNRGYSYQSLNQPDIALQDYQRGIGLSENLQQRLQDNFPNAWQNDLARSYMNRGYSYESLNQPDIALQDYQRGIGLSENLQQRLQDNFPNEWQNDLAGSYMNRGYLYQSLNQPDIALQDYQRGIGLSENLQQRLQDNFPNAWQNDLARHYMNRGYLYQSLNQPDIALQDYQQAIDLRENLKQRLQDNFPNEWQNHLAGSYMNRGYLYKSLNQPDIALQDYQQAIDLRENLKQRLQDNFPNEWQNDLAGSYRSRGYLYKSLNQPDIALQDYQQAIDLRENLKQRLQDNFPNEWQNHLAGSYMNRGYLYKSLNQPDIALQDYQQAIDLRENLKQRLQDNFPNEWQNHLAKSLSNRAFLLSKKEDITVSLSDYDKANRSQFDL